MIKLKKIAALAISCVMCAGLAFGAGCTDPEESVDPDNKVDTPATEVDNSGVKGCSSEVKAEYIQAIKDTYEDFETSSTGYEITSESSADVSYTDEYGTKMDMTYSLNSVARYKNVDGAVSEDQDIYLSSETVYTEGSETYTEGYNMVSATRVRGTDIYSGVQEGDEKFTSIPEDMLFSKTSYEDLYGELSDELSEYGSMFSEMYGFDIGSLDSDSLEGISQSSADLLIKIVESPVCAVYGTVETTSDGSILAFDIVKEAEYMLTSASSIVALIGESTTPEQLAEDTTVRALVEMYFGDLTGADIQQALEMILGLTGDETLTIPEAAEGSSAYDYLISLFSQTLEEEDLTSPQLSEYKEYAQQVIEQCREALSACKQFTVNLYFDGDKNYTGYDMSAVIEGGETYGIDADIQSSLEIVKKDVTLAEINNSYVYSEVGILKIIGTYYINDYIYFMEDGTVMLECFGYEDGELVGTYKYTGLKYTRGANGTVNYIEGGVFSDFSITFSYDGITYILVI